MCKQDVVVEGKAGAKENSNYVLLYLKILYHTSNLSTDLKLSILMKRKNRKC